MDATDDQTQPSGANAMACEYDRPGEGAGIRDPLPLKPGELRLLTLYHSTEWTSTIDCELSLAQYSEAGYYALSYVWGSSTNLKPIRVNGILKYVTTNLESALRHSRDATLDLTLWIDALCIN